MMRLGESPTFSTSVALDHVSGSAAVMRRASARTATRAHDESFTLPQRVARYGLTVLAVVVASALFAAQVHAMLH